MFNLASNNPDKSPYTGKVLDRDGKEATVWPDHCLKGTWGAEHLPGVKVELFDRTFPKGTELDKDYFSGAGNPDFIPYLKEKGVTHVYLVGLVESICIASTAIDLAKDFKVFIVREGVCDLPSGMNVPENIEACKELGVEWVDAQGEVIAGSK